MGRGMSTSSGPPPDPNAFRRDRSGDGAWIDLPPEGRTGRAPTFPLISPTPRERALWAIEWKRPQAVEWERNHMEVEVALYIRRLSQVELVDAPATLGTLVRQMQESLGLSLPGLARNRWRLRTAASYPTATGPKFVPKASSRTRLTIVDPPESTD